MNLAVLVSGNGSNLQAILDADQRGALAPARVVVVVSNRPGVRALERAAKAGVPALVLPHAEFATRQAFDEALVALLARHDVELVALAGFMRILSPVFLRAFAGRVVNIHPSLLPAFPGVHAQQQALDYGARVSGCTVHFVDEGCDTGPVIMQAAVPILPDDTAATLSARILEQEHALFPAALAAIAQGRVTVAGRRVVIQT